MLTAALSLAACASPTQSTGIMPNTGKGPVVDLGSFVSPDDLATPADLATGNKDLAMTPDMATASDLAQAPDLAMSSNCGSITYNGICQGDILKYCDTSGKLVTVDCWAQYFGYCDVVSGVADCYLY